MKRTHTTLALAALAALGLAAAHPALAQTTQAFHSGTFTQDDQVALYSFNVTTNGTVSLFTNSYGGGGNVNGTRTAPGGFDTILTLFDGSGNLIASNDDNVNANTDPVTHQTFDAGLQETLTPGLYTAAVTEFDNFAKGPTLFDGFQEQGKGNFTQMFSVNGTQAPFLDVTGAKRTGNYTLNIKNGDLPVAAPEPSQFAAFAVGLLGLGALAIRARKRQAA